MISKCGTHMTVELSSCLQLFILMLIEITGIHLHFVDFREIQLSFASMEADGNPTKDYRYDCNNDKMFLPCFHV